MSDRRQRSVDAALATVVLAVVVGLAVAFEVSPDPPAVLAGAVATLFFEVVAARHHDRIRRTWERPATRIGGLCVGIAAVVAGSSLAPGPTISAAAGALGTYLLLLAVVAAGLAPGPSTWWE